MQAVKITEIRIDAAETYNMKNNNKFLWKNMFDLLFKGS